ncbi:MAG: restriction endonuclease [Planctomycetota bacterium]|nr:MAG: restriction endonuclease [Planctomycetota bacterium]REJ89502.1 MAG: restriction endonuclease [Planctomycetota bacterium]REK28927.1 MAG: restriction endonuclease [Planctomycetota bacterium]REK39639.1 MAG: restriction endonuclease [Planctomycetota bacterium]
MSDLEKRVAEAVKSFWQTRDRQSRQQGLKTGQRDAGLRTAVTAGKHMDGFIEICRDLCVEGGVPEAEVFWKNRKELPGYYRAEKNWDLIVVAGDQLLAVIEFKAQVGPSFGNNFNNRTEEALGNATDLWAAYREGAFAPSARPWLGYLFILEDCPKSRSPVQVKEPHFPVFPEFKGASYAKRYETLLTKLLRERLYDGACLLLTSNTKGSQGHYSTPSEELGFENFAAGLSGHVIACARSRKGTHK